MIASSQAHGFMEDVSAYVGTQLAMPFALRHDARARYCDISARASSATNLLCLADIAQDYVLACAVPSLGHSVPSTTARAMG